MKRLRDRRGSGTSPDGWSEAVELLAAFARRREHLDDLLDHYRPGRAHGLVMESFRQWFRIERLLEGRLRKNPRPRVHALLRLALAEALWHGGERAEVIVHHAVDIARHLGMSESEAKFLNGVLRAVFRDAEGFHALRRDPWAAYPDWMGRRWRGGFGEERALALCKWNEKRPPWYVRAEKKPPWAERTGFDGYYRVPGAQTQRALAALASGEAYAQDPFAGIPVDLLEPHPGEIVHDYCAAPGGKSREMAARMGGRGRLVVLDRPGRRSDRLEENLRHLPSSFYVQLRCSLEEVREDQLGQEADGILLDVPCSNTGVLARRPDVKVRLREEDIVAMAATQLGLLEKAATHLRPGGRLVYSTCSLEKEENDDVVETFLSRNRGWGLAETRFSFPPEADHDGGGAFLLTSPAAQ